MTGRDQLPIWTVYAQPTDMPDAIVARKFLVGGGMAAPQMTMDVMVFPIGDGEVQAALTKARSQLSAMGLTRLPRSPEDEPQIVESWI